MGKVYKFTEEEINQMVKMYVKDFVSTNDIAKFFNVDPSVIVARLNKIGVKIAKGSAYSKEYWLERRFTLEDSIIKSKEFQKNSNNVYVSKIKNKVFAISDCKPTGVSTESNTKETI